MRATIKNYLEAAKVRREETGESGFSLIELIVVVVIIGILAAIALPLFGFIQRTAVDGATEAATKNAATTAVANVASDDTPTDAEIEAMIDAMALKQSTTLTLDATGTTATTICVTGFDTAGQNYTTAATGYKSGPGC